MYSIKVTTNSILIWCTHFIGLLKCQIPCFLFYVRCKCLRRMISVICRVLANLPNVPNQIEVLHYGHKWKKFIWVLCGEIWIHTNLSDLELIWPPVGHVCFSSHILESIIIKWSGLGQIYVDFVKRITQCSDSELRDGGCCFLRHVVFFHY